MAHACIDCEDSCDCLEGEVIEENCIGCGCDCWEDDDEDDDEVGY